jgi:hypothetical protein
LAEAEVERSGGEQRGASVTGPETIHRAPQRVHHRDAGQPEQRWPQAGYKLAHPKQLEIYRSQPVHERWLFEVLDVIEMWGDPVAQLDHFARDLGVARFIRFRQTETAQQT